MAIDIRATVTCSLGTLISASINDDYVQGTGLIKCKGSVELSGVYTPAIGTAVTFSYTKGGVTTQVPRKLRVLSSFADPFRRTTKVELGCKLTYLSDLQDQVDWSAFNDPGNSGYTEADSRIVTLPIRASSVMNECLTQLGITASSNPLTNKFLVAAFDFSAGYVNVLSDLLVSESYCGYLNTSEVLQVFSLDQDGGSGPVIDNTKLIDLGPIGVGSLPGEAVTVSYSTLKLKEPEDNTQEDENTLWEREEVVSETTDYPISYTLANGTKQTKTYSGRDVTVTLTTYKEITLYKKISRTFYANTLEKKYVVDKRITTVTSPMIKGLGSYVSVLLSAGGYFYNYDITAKKVVVEYSYDPEGEQTGVKTTEYEAAGFAVGRLNIPWTLGATAVATDTTLSRISRTVETTSQAAGYTRNVVSRYIWWPLSQVGQQAVAEMRETFTTALEVQTYLYTLLNYSGEVHEGTEVSTRQLGLSKNQGRPTSADLIAARNADGGDPNNGWRTESTAELELALGSATAQRRTELTMPVAPDDVFSGPSGGPFTAVASDAPAKANRYGRCQNRLLLGNRSGMNVQMAPELLPSTPFAPFIVQANGLSALYRTNGTSWQMDASGILVSTDALFWGAVGGTGAFWFPVAPGITTLPTTPAIVGGQMTVGTVVPVWNETVAAIARTSTKLEVTSLNYPLTLLTEVPVVTYNRLVSLRISSFYVSGAADTSYDAVAPRFDASLDVRPSAVDSAIVAWTPVVGREVGVYVTTTATDMVIAAYAPTVPASLWHMRPPVATVAVDAPVPVVGRLVGVYVAPAAAAISIAAPAPTRA